MPGTRDVDEKSFETRKADADVWSKLVGNFDANCTCTVKYHRLTANMKDANMLFALLEKNRPQNLNLRNPSHLDGRTTHKITAPARKSNLPKYSTHPMVTLHERGGNLRPCERSPSHFFGRELRQEPAISRKAIPFAATGVVYTRLADTRRRRGAL